MKATPALPATITRYLQATNSRDAAAFQSAFAPDAIVHDIGREIRGHDAIMRWAAEEIFAVNVTLEPLSVVERDGHTILTVKVDGAFDRTGLPDPLIMDHLITLLHDKISELACRLTEGNG